jgi:hypothetical protein
MRLLSSGQDDARPSSFWLVGPEEKVPRSDSHYYVFVNLRADAKHEYFVVPAAFVGRNTQVTKRVNSTWYGFSKSSAEQYRDAWEQFGTLQKAN